MTLSNRVTLDQLSKMGSKEVEALPVDQIALLLEAVSEQEKATKAAKEKLHTACVLRWGARAQVERRSAGKDTGTVTLTEGEYTIKADLPKAPEWDQDILDQIACTIRDVWKREPAEYIEAKLSVAEAKYCNWPSDLRDVFTPARTLKTGKPTFKFDLNKAEAA